jgi:hypothetical protein
VTTHAYSPLRFIDPTNTIDDKIKIARGFASTC